MTIPPLLPPRPLDPANEPARQAALAGAWMCRSCAHVLRVTFRYPPSPWAYCHRCSGTLVPEEQLAAIARQGIDRVRTGTAVTGPGQGDVRAEHERPLLTVAEVAGFFGKSKQAIYKMVFRGQLAGVTRVAGRIYIRRADLLRSLAEGRVPSSGRGR